MLTSSSTITVASSTIMTTSTQLQVLPPYLAPNGKGKIVHPLLGAFDYEVKPDEWVNVDGDVIIPPVWSSSKTLSGAANTLWAGNIRDVVAEERWNQPLSMPITQLRIFLFIWTTPIDPAVGYVQWYPNYINNNGYNVIPLSLSAGDQDNLVFDDVVNTKDFAGNPDGWMTKPVTFKLKLVARIS